MTVSKDWCYDLETYPNCFTMTIISLDLKIVRSYEVSTFKNEINGLIRCLEYLRDNDCSMYGFNNLGFDYPILHKLLSLSKLPDTGEEIAKLVYTWAQDIINAMKTERFAQTVSEKDWIIPQVDIYKIHHFDNKAKNTSLKLLEFNMRSDNVEELPFPVGTILTREQINVLLSYNAHDVRETIKFINLSKDQIEFRKKLTEKYGRNFMNHNDTKIGKDYFAMRLQEQGIELYRKEGNKRVIIQTKRPIIKVQDCLFNYYDFKRPEFIAVLEWFRSQRIRETKGVFTDLPEHKLGDVAQFADMRERRKKFELLPGHTEPTESQIDDFKRDYPLGWIEEITLSTSKVVKIDGKKHKVYDKSYWKVWKEAWNLNVVIDGFKFDFGTGGIHGSVSDKVVKETKSWMIKDADVSSQYPNLAISNRVYPQHLGEEFCDIYQDVYNQRKSYPKGTAENAMLKLALNGVYGDSNNEYSIFYDPQYTMSITINGQLTICLLAEKLLAIPELRFVQVNTDGITVAIKREYEQMYYDICKKWQEQVKLELEFADYSKMFIRDCNAYIAVYTNGKVKRKGPYQYADLGWHQDQSALVIRKAVEAHMLHGTDIEEFVSNHQDKFDFMLRTKVPRSSELYLEMPDGTRIKQQNVCRYYPSKNGGKLIKIMPPNPRKGADAPLREIGIDKNYLVKTCNNMKDFDGDIDFSYYVEEAKKLLLGAPKQEVSENPSDNDEES